MEQKNIPSLEPQLLDRLDSWGLIMLTQPPDPFQNTALALEKRKPLACWKTHTLRPEVI